VIVAGVAILAYTFVCGAVGWALHGMYTERRTREPGE
jgi:hypothetical protein